MRTREPRAIVLLNPGDAGDRGLQDGDDTVVASETGRLNMRVFVSEDVPPGVALTHKGRWPKGEQGQANVNVLNPGHKADMGESTCVHGIEVSVVPMRGDVERRRHL
jgi:anaerobic selenocysteine-containing dehydrogenase